MTFKKYSSIINHYRQKELTEFAEHNPDILTAPYEIQEKIHGANIQLIFSPGKSFAVASRNRVLEDGQDFYGIRALLEQQPLKDFASFVQSEADAGMLITLYGEVFGAGVQKGVTYGNERRVVFFDMALNGELISPASARIYFSLPEGEFAGLFISQLAVVDGLEAALEFDAEITTQLGPNTPDNIAEGIVIKPLEVVYRDLYGSRLAIKKKNEAFKERAHAKKPNQQVPEGLKALHQEFLLYLTPMRLQSVFSKNGEIAQPSQMGEYIRLIL